MNTQLLMQIRMLEHSAAPCPWFLDECNMERVIVRDRRGDVVLHEEFCFPDDAKSFMIEEHIKRFHATAKLMIVMSEFVNQTRMQPRN